MRDEDMQYLRAAIDKLRDGQAQANLILERNTITLEEHVRRTALLEDRFKPVERHVAGVQFVLKLSLAAAPIVGLAKALKLL